MALEKINAVRNLNTLTKCPRPSTYKKQIF